MTDIATIDLSHYIGATVGTVTLVKLLGRGAMGAVFVGYQATLKRQVAVKILPKSLAGSDKAQRMFRDEAETVGILSHPNIVPVYEMGETSDFFFQVMQLVIGHDLKTIIGNARKHPVPTRRILPFSETVRYICQILDALAYAHEEGVVHQDIKPANILVDDRFKRPMVADFGIARSVWAEYEDNPVLLGTPLYMSPEQSLCATVDSRADIYSVGVMLLEMTAGVLPTHRESPADMIHRKRTAPDTFFTARPSEVNPSLDLDLESIILQAIAPPLEKRFRDCVQFRTALESYAAARGVHRHSSPMET